MESVIASKDVEITAVYFRNDPAAVRFESYPRLLSYKGRRYVLAEI